MSTWDDPQLIRLPTGNFLLFRFSPITVDEWAVVHELMAWAQFEIGEPVLAVFLDEASGTTTSKRPPGL